jgi:ribosomal protein L6P/L9E
MACNITTGRAKACKEFQGGVQSLYLFNFLENAFTVVDGEATAINPLLTEVFEYKVEGDGQTLVENMVSDRNTSTTVNTQTITAMLKGIDAETSAELNLVAKGYPMAVVRDRNGVYHAVGLDDGIDFTIDQATGGAKTDMNGYTITGVSTTGSLSPKLDSTTITAFLALID